MLLRIVNVMLLLLFNCSMQHVRALFRFHCCVEFPSRHALNDHMPGILGVTIENFSLFAI